MPDATAAARITRPDGWQILKRNRAAVIALGFLVGLSLLAIVLPMLLPESLKVTSSASFVPPMQRA
jgi:peptide/nickel transport system permease protein/oligopeptide transport system permease protein